MFLWFSTRRVESQSGMFLSNDVMNLGFRRRLENNREFWGLIDFAA